MKSFLWNTLVSIGSNWVGLMAACGLISLGAPAFVANVVERRFMSGLLANVK